MNQKGKRRTESPASAVCAVYAQTLYIWCTCTVVQTPMGLTFCKKGNNPLFRDNLEV